MSFKNVRSDNPLKKSIQDELRKANGLSKGRGKVTSVRYNAETGEAMGTVFVPHDLDSLRRTPRSKIKMSGVPYATTVKMAWKGEA